MGLYIQTHSIHGLFRSENLELGIDEDTGGQIVYVLELAKNLGELKEVDRVDIITRWIYDPEHPGYSDKEEKVSKNVYIRRIECGPEKYIKKVNLWPYIDEFVENVKKYIEEIGRKPDVLHSNYADAGLVCVKLSKDMGIPQVHTGHSLGIPKMKKLGINDENYEEYNKIYHFDKRLEAENKSIHNSSAIVVSTEEEIEEQYGEYDLKDCDKFEVIPPGVPLAKFHPPEKNLSEKEKKILQVFENCINQGVKTPQKPIIGILTRLDRRKNVHGFLKGYSADKELQELANVIIFTNTLRGDEETQEVIDIINKTLRKGDLYNKVALPGIKIDYEKEVPIFYRFLARNNGIFVNPSLFESFGITILEGSACGVPVVATKYGGPSETIEDGVNGILTDTKDPLDIASKAKMLIKDKKLYKRISKNAVKNVRDNYSWEKRAERYLEVFKEVI
jgi:sucrose-phosphate synthase